MWNVDPLADAHVQRIGVLAWQWPFMLCAALVVVAIALVDGGLDAGAIWAGALAVAALLGAALLPWHRIHPLWVVAIGALDLAAAGVLVHGGGITAALALLVFPAAMLVLRLGPVGAVAAAAGGLLTLWLPPALLDRMPATLGAWVDLVAVSAVLVGGVGMLALRERRLRAAEAAAAAAGREGRRTAAILRSIVEEAPSAIALVDDELRPIVTNAAAQEQAVTARLRGGAAASVELFRDPDLRPLAQAEQPIFRVLAGEAVRDALVWIGPPGERRAILTNGRPVHDDDGERLGALLVGHDVTELVRETRAREASLSTLSHELRTPLTALIGHLELLQDEPLPPAVERALAAMTRSGERLEDLAERFLAAAGPAPEARRELVPLQSVVAGAIARLPARLRAEERVRVAVQEGATADLDPRLATCVLEALLRNALACSGAAPVRVSACADEAAAVLRVEDEGMGIPADELELVFERAYRATNARRQEIEGLGLGLSVALAAARAHGGSIELTSEVDIGTAATVLLPAGDEPAAAA